MCHVLLIQLESLLDNVHLLSFFCLLLLFFLHVYVAIDHQMFKNCISEGCWTYWTYKSIIEWRLQAKVNSLSHNFWVGQGAWFSVSWKFCQHLLYMWLWNYFSTVMRTRRENEQSLGCGASSPYPIDSICSCCGQLIWEGWFDRVE